jgi:hypothetical protein
LLHSREIPHPAGENAGLRDDAVSYTTIRRVCVENYFNYFTEIEEHYLRRRGGGLLLSTLDWALIETWKDAGIPLEAALRGIDAAFDRYDARPSRTKKVNSLAYCSQEVLAAAEDMKEAAVGAGGGEASAGSREGQGFETETVAAFLRRNAESIEGAKLAAGSVRGLALETAATLRRVAEEIENPQSPKTALSVAHPALRAEVNSYAASRTALRFEDLERRLTVMEEKLFAALLASTPDEEIVAVRADADRDLAPYRRKMSGAQIEQLQKQYVHKKLLEKYGLPRLSLFYM